MRVVFVADFVSELLGYQEYLLAKWVAREGLDVHLVTSDQNPPVRDYEYSFQPLLGPRQLARGRYVADGVNIHRIPRRLEFRSRIFLQGLDRTVRQIDPDLIFCHGTLSPTLLQSVRIAERLNVPLFADNHMVFAAQGQSPAARMSYVAARIVMRAYLAKRIDRFYGVAPECEQFLIEAQAAPHQKVRGLPLGVDTELFAYTEDGRRTKREQWDVKPDEIAVVQTGKMDRSKDPLTLARAVGKVQLNRPVVLVLVGSGPPDYIAECRQAVSANPGARLVVTGAVPVTELAAVFSASDLVCFAGGTSMSCFEAAACARLVMMNDLPTSVDRARVGVGVTFTRGDARDLALVLSRYASDEDGRTRLAQRARNVVIANYSYQKVARELVRDMESALASDLDFQHRW